MQVIFNAIFFTLVKLTKLLSRIQPAYITNLDYVNDENAFHSEP